MNLEPSNLEMFYYFLASFLFVITKSIPFLKTSKILPKIVAISFFRFMTIGVLFIAADILLRFAFWPFFMRYIQVHEPYMGLLQVASVMALYLIASKLYNLLRVRSLGSKSALITNRSVTYEEYVADMLVRPYPTAFIYLSLIFIIDIIIFFFAFIFKIY